MIQGETGEVEYTLYFSTSKEDVKTSIFRDTLSEGATIKNGARRVEIPKIYSLWPKTEGPTAMVFNNCKVMVGKSDKSGRDELLKIATFLDLNGESELTFNKEPEWFATASLLNTIEATVNGMTIRFKVRTTVPVVNSSKKKRWARLFSKAAPSPAQMSMFISIDRVFMKDSPLMGAPDTAEPRDVTGSSPDLIADMDDNYLVYEKTRYISQTITSYCSVNVGSVIKTDNIELAKTQLESTELDFVTGNGRILMHVKPTSSKIVKNLQGDDKYDVIVFYEITETKKDLTFSDMYNLYVTGTFNVVGQEETEKRCYIYTGDFIIRFRRNVGLIGDIASNDAFFAAYDRITFRYALRSSIIYECDGRMARSIRNEYTKERFSGVRLSSVDMYLWLDSDYGLNTHMSGIPFKKSEIKKAGANRFSFGRSNMLFMEGIDPLPDSMSVEYNNEVSEVIYKTDNKPVVKVSVINDEPFVKVFRYDEEQEDYVELDTFIGNTASYTFKLTDKGVSIYSDPIFMNQNDIIIL